MLTVHVDALVLPPFSVLFFCVCVLCLPVHQYMPSERPIIVRALFTA
jgi:hypothetical protein